MDINVTYNIINLNQIWHECTYTALFGITLGVKCLQFKGSFILERKRKGKQCRFKSIALLQTVFILG